MSKLTLPKAKTMALPHGITFEPAPGALARWNASVVAKDATQEEDNSISIYDTIGFDPWTGGGTTAKRIAGALRSIGKKDVVVNLNSPGGDVFEGIAIYNMFRDHPGEVTMRVLGLAASAASVIAMGGDKIQAASASFMMVHNVWVLAMGNRNDLRDAADQLEPFDDALAEVYAARTGLDKAKVAKMMDKETWFSGNQAIETGFADELLPADQVQEKDGAPASASLRAAEAYLARHGISRSERRALIKTIKDSAGGAQDAAAAEEHHEDLSTRDAAREAMQDAGGKIISGLTDYFRSKAAIPTST